MAKGIKTGGRTKGTPNKITSEIKESLKEFISNELNELMPKINELQTNERFNILVKLMPYIMPKETEQMAYDQKEYVINLNEIIQGEKKNPIEPVIYVVDYDKKPPIFTNNGLNE